MKKVFISLLVVLIFIVGCKEEKKSTKGDDTVMEILTGNWAGSIKIPNQALNIIVNFEENDEVTGTIEIPAQGVQDYPLSSIKADKNDLSFAMEIQSQLITFDGEVKGDTITGMFKQNGQSFPFELTKGKVLENKAEEYDEFLQVETKQGTLYGELETPVGKGSFPIVIIIPGSGTTDRNGNFTSPPGINNSLKFLAESLAAQGIASLRYDKRGAGKNIGAFESEEALDFDLFVDDAKRWVDLLNQDEAYTNLGIIGHSQGSLEGMLAAQEGNVDAFISLAGAGSSIDKVLYDQLSEQLPDDLLKESKEILEKLKEGKRIDLVSQELQSVFRPSVQPFMSSWMQYDPAEEIKKLDIPTLIINGEKDAELLFIENMNHVLKKAPNDREGNTATYFNPDLPLADGLVKGIVVFLKENGFMQ